MRGWGMSCGGKGLNAYIYANEIYTLAVIQYNRHAPSSNASGFLFAIIHNSLPPLLIISDCYYSSLVSNVTHISLPLLPISCE